MRRMITTKQQEFVDELNESTKVSMMEDYELHNILFPNEDMGIEEDVADFEEHVYEGSVWCSAPDLYPDYQGEDGEEAPGITLIVSMAIPEDIDNDADLKTWLNDNGLPANAQLTVDEYFFFKGKSGSPFQYELLPGSMPSYADGVDVTVVPEGLLTNWTLYNPVNPVDTLKLGAQSVQIQNGFGETQLTVNANGVISNVGIPETYSTYTPTNVTYGEGIAFFKLSGLAASKHEHLLIHAYAEDADGGEHALMLSFQKRLIIDNHKIVKTWDSAFDIDRDDVSQATGKIITFNPAAGSDKYELCIPNCDLTSITFYDVYSW